MGKMMTTLPKDSIDETLVMEFYTNAYDPKSTYPTKAKVRGKTMKFDPCTLNVFSKTLVNLQPLPGTDNLLTHMTSKYHKMMAAKLCKLRKGFEMSHDASWRIHKESMNTLTSLGVYTPTTTLCPLLTLLTSTLVKLSSFTGSRWGWT